MTKHLVFDVNETLLDVSALDPLFERLFGNSATRQEWFLTLQENWLTATIVDDYRPFGELAKSALAMVGRRRNIKVTSADEQSLINGIMTLPAHEDVAEALELLSSKGFTLAALTNSTLTAARKQLASAQLSVYFEHILSVDEVQRYKPAAEPYRMAARRLGVGTGEITMVAAHAWDITGAAAAGCRTAFVARPGKVINPAGAQPDYFGKTVLEVAQKL
ncbi:MAG: haloacid dehalogenase type II [Alteromonadaceae bacterium]|mgnify:CR=1 FL=1|nr:haloacid dehalogenase type II [Alteromonadaceae bacterium]|tara:strand:- start:871 stop:1527 length:657 start_codon:yes stop_codon:yes gene_type:complete